MAGATLMYSSVEMHVGSSCSLLLLLYSPSYNRALSPLNELRRHQNTLGYCGVVAQPMLLVACPHT